tara:strand:- start:186 stop:1031 length:846 start_codon:yes stop_codon:yes gene_type:complete
MMNRPYRLVRRSRPQYNPDYGVPIAAIPLAYLIGGGVVTAGTLIGGAYAYNAAKIDVKQYDADIVLKNAAKIIGDVQGGLRAEDPDPMTAMLSVKGITTSALRPPPTEKGGYAQAAIYLAVAAAMDGGNQALLEHAVDNLAKAEVASTDATDDIPVSQKIQPLKDAQEILVATQNKRFLPVVQRLLMLQRKEGVEDTMQDVKTYSKSELGKEALGETVKDVATPFVFMGALFSGKNPFGIKNWQWQLIRWSVIIGGGYMAFNVLSAPIRDFAKLAKARPRK